MSGTASLVTDLLWEVKIEENGYSHGSSSDNWKLPLPLCVADIPGTWPHHYTAALTAA